MPPKITRDVVGDSTLIVIEDRSLPVIHFMVGTRRGSVFDPIRESGALATYLELMLRGTKRQSRESFAQALETLGSGLASSVGREAAALRGSALTRHFPTTWSLTQEAWCTPRLDPDERQDLVEETIDELKGATDDDDTLADIFLRRALYPLHPFARSSHGEISDLEAQTDVTLKTVAERHLHPRELIFLFAGDITIAEAARHVESFTASCSLAAPNAPQGESEAPPSQEGEHRADAKPPFTPPSPSPGKRRLVLVDKPGRTQVQLRLAQLSVSGSHPDALALWLGICSFGGTFSAPFCQEIREKRGWSYYAGTSYDRRRRFASPVMASAAPSSQDAVPALELSMAMLDQLAEGDLDPAAIAHARNYNLNRYPFSVATASDLMGAVFRGELLGEAAQAVFEFPERLRSLSDDQVRAALREHLRADSGVAVMVATAAEQLEHLEKLFERDAITVVDYRASLSTFEQLWRG